MLVEAKDALRDGISAAVAREQERARELHESDLAERARQHALNLEDQKKHLQAETDNLADQLKQQSELKDVLDKLQQKTMAVQEVVQTNLKQRDEELRQREQNLMRAERELQLELDTEIAIEEKRLEEEEKRLQMLKEDLLK